MRCSVTPWALVVLCAPPLGCAQPRQRQPAAPADDPPPAAFGNDAPQPPTNRRVATDLESRPEPEPASWHCTGVDIGDGTSTTLCADTVEQCRQMRGGAVHDGYDMTPCQPSNEVYCRLIRQPRPTLICSRTQKECGFGNAGEVEVAGPCGRFGDGDTVEAIYAAMMAAEPPTPLALPSGQPLPDLPPEALPAHMVGVGWWCFRPVVRHLPLAACARGQEECERTRGRVSAQSNAELEPCATQPVAACFVYDIALVGRAASCHANVKGCVAQREYVMRDTADHSNVTLCAAYR